MQTVFEFCHRRHLPTAPTATAGQRPPPAPYIAVLEADSIPPPVVVSLPTPVVVWERNSKPLVVGATRQVLQPAIFSFTPAPFFISNYAQKETAELTVKLSQLFAVFHSAALSVASGHDSGILLHANS